MELNLETVNGPPTPAATVILLRDGVHGLEVFLVKRHIKSNVLGGAFVFPGGKVDKLDADKQAILARLRSNAMAAMANMPKLKT